MPVRTAHATWRGDLKGGDGRIELASGPFTGEYTYATRFEEEPGTNPDELLGAALTSCYSMFLANILAQDGHTPSRIRSEARVHLSTEGGAHIERIELSTRGEVPELDLDTFRAYAERAKACPVSQALSVPVELEAALA